MEPRHKLLRLTVLGVVFLAALLPAHSLAGTFFVDQNHPQASDINPGTEALPWRTLHRAVDGIPSLEQGGIPGTFPPVQAGDTVYVKNGSYVDVQGPSGFITAYRPTNSGTAGAPIAFRAYTPPTGPRHAPILHRSPDSTSDANDAYAVIGSAARNYIIWDGFVLAPGTTALTGGDGLTTGIGNVFENLQINFGVRPCTAGNPASLYMAGATNSIIRNNRILGALYDSTSVACFGPNARGIYLINSGGNLIQNNEISDAGGGIGIKRVGWDNIFERNYIHDIAWPDGAAIGIGVADTTQCPPSPRRCDSSNNVIRQNIFVRAAVGYQLTPPSDGVANNNQVYNNTMYVVANGATPGGSNSRFYNNIVHLDMATGGRQAHIGFWNGLPAGFASNFSMYFDTTGLQGHFYPHQCCLGELTLLGWQAATGQDANSSLADPLFVGPLTGTPPPAAFQLQSVSPARNAGRVGGVFTGTQVNMGAYISASDVIGTGNSDVMAPSPPTNLGVQ